jgi:Cu+-exporting ATPase
MVVDPVCGMKIEQSEAAATEEFGGTRWYFCSKHCEELFKEDPEQYLANR